MGGGVNIFETLYDEDRPLLKEEYANLREKQLHGYMNVEFFRKNMFNPTARGTRVQYKKPKLIWKKGDLKISVSHSLHQKHSDILSLIHSDSKSVSKPSKDGGYEIRLSLYRIAKLMGYSNPKSSAHKVSGFINDLRWTDLIVSKEGKGGYRSTILDDAYFSEDKDVYIVKIKGKNAKILAHTTAIRFEKELTHRIVLIPDNLSKLKAMVRFVISNKPTAHGYTLKFIFEKFGIGQSGSENVKANSKSLFKKQLLENETLLSEFNLEYRKDEQKVYYLEQLDRVTFELGFKPNIILKKLESNTNPYATYIGKKFKVDDVIFTITEVTPSSTNEGKVDLVLENHSGEVGKSKNNDIENISKLISVFEN